ncbi:MAG: phosphotransferase [Oscillospiraceae bacterium]|nr:phosphotransferase [Oscillospiraceae bacterium]
MKISFMLKREDFYSINQKTLERYYTNSKNRKRLYIYPELNAIVTARPSKTVRQYLYTEFRVNGSFLKRLLVRLYATVMLNSRGLLAAKSVVVHTDATKDTLIYPCNKKYRVFDFDKNEVSVIGKDGFPTIDLSREIEFRTHNHADFIPGLIRSSEQGYSEVIIDGCPVARTGERMTSLCDKAFAIWNEYIAPSVREIPAADYAKELHDQFQVLKNSLQELNKQVNDSQLDQLWEQLQNILQASQDNVPVGLSHGDLQAGNIWVENQTDKLYIIDWESWKNRSTWYDRALLYEGLRRTDGLEQYSTCRDLIHTTVLMEDIIFRMTELTTLPLDYGCAEFTAYINTLCGGTVHV